MKIAKIDVEKRDVSIPARRIRLQNRIPAVFYGKGEGSTPLQMDYQTFRRLFLKGGYSQLLDMTIDGKTNKKAIIQEVVLNPISGKIEHVDFKRVSLKEKISTRVPVEIVGVSPAVKDLGAIMNVAKSHLEVKCLPTHIPRVIEVDISNLKEVPSAFHVSDLAQIEGVEIDESPESAIIIVNAPRVEEEPVAGEAVAEGAVAAEGEGPTEGAEDKKEDVGAEEKKD